MDKPKKPHTSDEETAPPPALPHPSAQSPFRPLSRRRRQQQPAQPASAVDRPDTSLVFDASPTTITAALAKAKRPPAEPVRLVWTRRSDRPVAVTDGGDIDIEPSPPPDT